MRIIVVEDDADLREELVFNLSEDGFNAIGAGDADELYRELHARRADMLILDVGLPGKDGFTIAGELRADPAWRSLGVIMLTARGELSQRVQGLTIGADAYLVKPVDFLELRACIESLARRLAISGPDAPPSRWVYSPAKWELSSPCGTTVKLTLVEKKLVEVLIRTAGAAVKRRDIIVVGLGESLAEYDERRLEAAISRLRRKIEQSCPRADPIRAVHGIGYVFAEPVDISAAGRA